MLGLKHHLIYLFPLMGFLINGLWGKRMSKTISGIIGSGAILVSFLISSYVFYTIVQGAKAIDENVFAWISGGGIDIAFGLLFDQLSATWLMVVTGIGFLIHVYSVAYMHEDENFSRFFAYLNLFVFFMLLLVLGNNFLVTFIGWEGVGLCSYLLIGFWFRNQDYNNAAKKAFVMNRIGDLGFLLGMFLLLFYFGSLHFNTLKATVGVDADHAVIVAATLFLFIGACGKSAQIPLYTWLPDAMAGPTPVSALIHAATMVTAGIYMIVRANFLYELAPETLQVIAVVGAATALFAASIGLLQNDIKKVLAYSTVSQLGLMFLALGLGAYVSGVFHVVTHAFFKACLFLGSGSVIHALHGQQDIRGMGGLKKWMPVTFWTFTLSALAISGIPPFSGFFSKDEILAQAFLHNKALWAVASLASALTAFYMFRLVYITFFNDFRGTEEQKHHLHESPALITVPLMILAALAVLGGLMGLPSVLSHHHSLSEFLQRDGVVTVHAHEISHSTEWMLMGIAVVVALASIAFAYMKYISKKELPVADSALSGFSKVVANKYYVDELYDQIVQRPIRFLSEIFHDIVDRKAVDGVVNWSGAAAMLIGKRIRSVQTGNTGFYLIVMVLALCLMLCIGLLR